MYGSLSPDVLGLVHDFTRCVRPNGTVYGTKGQCRKGVEQKIGEQSKPSREERRKRILDQANIHRNTSAESLKNNIETVSNLIKNEPGFKSPLTEDTLKALRLLRLKAHLEASKAKREERESLDKETENLLKNSPKYTETPGSRKPLPRFTQEGEIKRITSDLETLKEKIKDAERSNTSENRAKLALLQSETKVLEKSLARAKEGNFIMPTLSSIYSRQGFNARPQVVAKATDLETMPGLMDSPNGRRIIAYRGVTSVEHALQFKGGGPEGETHFPGKGIFGNGSYAAAAPAYGSSSKGDSPQKIAANYTDLWEENGTTSLRRQVTAFAFREDARVVTFKTEKEYDSWKVKTLVEAEKQTGYPFYDVGAAAAALGYHAFNVPVLASSDYWVVLNRGSIVVAADSELKNEDYQ